MPSSDVAEDEVTPKEPTSPTTPRRTPAVRRAPNATSKRKVSATKAGTPKSAPARTKTGGTKKREATLLGDFLLGRPSVNRGQRRRRSLEVVKAEMKTAAVNKLQPPGGVKDRVKQWQKASAAAVIEDPAAPGSEPEVELEMDDKSVDEEDRQRIKKGLTRPVKKKPQEVKQSPTPVTPKGTPKKRVVSDDHWMQKKKSTNKKSTTDPQGEKKLSSGKTLPKDFVQTNWANPPLERKIQDWANRTTAEPELSPPKVSLKSRSKSPNIKSIGTDEKVNISSRDNSKIESKSKETPTKEKGRVFMKEVHEKDTTETLTKDKPGDDGIRVRPKKSDPFDDGICVAATRRQKSKEDVPTIGLEADTLEKSDKEKEPHREAIVKAARKSKKYLIEDTLKASPKPAETRRNSYNEAPQERKPSKKRSATSAPKVEKRPASSVSSWTGSSEDDYFSNDDVSQSLPRARGRYAKSRTGAESLADIPVGFSAFSVLDLPLGKDARNRKTSNPIRRPSLVAVPRVLKKVYAEGMKMVHDTVEPPRIGVNQPPSIESWLKGTSDPFVEQTCPSEGPKDTTEHGPRRRRSHEQRASSRRDSASNVDKSSHPIGDDKSDAVISTLPSRSIIREDGPETLETVRDKDKSRTRTIDENNSPFSFRGLKRSPATRNTSSPIKTSGKHHPRSVISGKSQDSAELSSRGKYLEKCDIILEDEQQVTTGNGARITRSLRQIEQSNDSRNGASRIASLQLPVYSSSSEDKQRSTEQPRSFDRKNLWNDGRHRLSTIASVETFSSHPSTIETGSELSQTTITQDTSSTCCSTCITGTESSLSRKLSSRSGLKRRLTKHSDLMSVLSLPDEVLVGDNKSIRSAHSIRTARTRLATATITDLLNELAEDEVKYMRELRTLVDGVIPVLLTSVLSKSDSAIAAGLLITSSNGGSDSSVTKPIVDMGIALERLKSLHKRIPMADLDQLLHWASSAYKVYDDYLSAWRTGFHDIVVNLAPAYNASDKDSLLDGLSRNAAGDVLNGDGERVDVAYLLKRPLVRVKYLAKTTKGLRLLLPSPQSEAIDIQYQALLEKTRRRTKEENARREDMLANNADATRVRDPRNLAPLENVQIDRSRQVKAKDFFALELEHSNGQRLACEVEIILRDKAGDPGDVLICEVDDQSSQWLLFPPIEHACISAREGEKKGELIVMIRGYHNSVQWQETLSLIAEELEAAEDFLLMLGSDPLPPLKQIVPAPVGGSFDSRAMMSGGLGDLDVLDIPIGERPARYRQKQRADRGTPTKKTLMSEYEQTNQDHVYNNPSLDARSPKKYVEPSRDDHQQRSPDAAKESLSRQRYLKSRIADFEKGDTKQWTKSGSDSLEVDERQEEISSVSIRAGAKEHIPRDKTDANEYRPLSSAGPIQVPVANSKSRIREDAAPLPPPHRSPGRSSPTRGQDILLAAEKPKHSRHNHSSSPLKNEYHPSDASATSHTSDSSETDDEYTSDSSDDDDELEGAEISSPLPGSRFGRYIAQSRPISSSREGWQPTKSAIVSSNSSPEPQQTAAYTIGVSAHVSSWSNSSGRWDNLHPEVCSILVTPGLLEVYAVNYSQSNPGAAEDGMESRGSHLVAFALFPTVLIRQSTGLDIEIHSPPLESSSVKCTGIVRFRTRCPEDGGSLYAAVRKARNDNQEYNRMEQERILSGYGAQNETPEGNRRRSWFGRQRSYRASARAPSNTGSSSSSFSISSAFSALRRMGKAGNFNIEKSSIDMAQGGLKSGGTSLYTSSSESGSSGRTPPHTPTDPSVATTGRTVDSMLFRSNDLEIRLYILVTGSKWEELGSTLLTVSQPPAGARQASALNYGIEKRIIITKPPKTKGGAKEKNEKSRIDDQDRVVLMDHVLGAKCFAHIGTTGIVMNVWEDITGPNGEVGMIGAVGGVSGRTKKYMISCKDARQAKWIFALLGGGG